MAANTLYEYYSGQGQRLPSIQERSTIYETSGLGTAKEYVGTAEQNTALLGKLQTPTPAPTPAPSVGPVPAEAGTPNPTPTPTPDVVETKTTTESTPPPSEIDTAGEAAKQALTEKIAFQQSQYDRLQTEFDNYTKDIAEIDAENSPIIQDIKDTFARRVEEMNITNQAMQNQTAISGLRGMARYAAQTQRGFVSNEITNGMNRISELESQKRQAVQQAKIALKSEAKDRWVTFNNFMDTAAKAYEDKVQAVVDLHTYLKDEEDRTRMLAKADIEMQQLQQELDVTTAENIAGSVFSVLGDNWEENMDYISSVAQENDIDPNILISQLQTYQQEQEEQIFDRASDLWDFSQDLEQGQSAYLPGTDILINGTKKPETVSITRELGGKNYRYEYIRKGDGSLEQVGEPVDMGWKWKPSNKNNNVVDTAVEDMREQLSTIIGGDGFISPENYSKARVAWIEQNLDPSEFDKEFSAFRNPANLNYDFSTKKVTTKSDESPETTTMPDLGKIEEDNKWYEFWK